MGNIHGRYPVLFCSFIALCAASACSEQTEGAAPCVAQECSSPDAGGETAPPTQAIPTGEPTPDHAPPVVDGGGKSSGESTNADADAASTKPHETARGPRSWLAYTTEGDHPLERDLFLASKDSLSRRDQIALGKVTWFEWLPDGSAVAYGVKTPGTPHTSIVLSELDGGVFREPRRIFEGSTEQCSLGTWSPDSGTLAIPCDERLVFVPRSGSSPRSVWLTQKGRSPRWSPDSQRVWISAEPRPGELYHTVISQSASAAPPMQRLDFAKWAVPRWAPDGSRLLLNVLTEGSTYMAYSLDPSTAESMAAPIPLGTRDDSTDLWCMDFLSPDEPALLRQTETHADVTTATLDGSAVTNLGHFSPSPGWRVTSVKLVSGKALIGTYASEPDAKGEVEYEIDARLLGNARGRSLARAASPRLAVAADLSGTLSISPRSEGPILVYGTGLSPRRYPLARVEEGAEYPAFFFSEDGTRAFFVQKHAGDVTARARYVDLRGATPRTFALQSREDADAHTAAFSPDGSALGYLTEQDGRTALHVTDVSGAEPSAPVSVAAERDVLAWAWQPSAE